LREIQPRWPDDASLVLQLNAGQPGEQTWLSSDMVRSILARYSGPGTDISLHSVRWDAT
jgi:hypothetical protein